MKKAILIVFLIVLPCQVRAGINLLANGDFEQSPFGYGWNGIRTDSRYTPGLNGSNNAIFLKGYDSGGWITQSFSGVQNEWQFQVSFLTEKTTTSPFSGFRFMLQYDNGNVNNASQIYFVTRWSGATASVGAYNSKNGVFETILPNVINSSYDSNGDGDYEDASDTKYVYHLSITGHYNQSLAKAFYDIELHDDNGILKGQSSNNEYYNRGNPTTSVPNYIIFPTSFPERNMTPSVFDDISIQNIVPEPTTLLLMGMGGMAICLKKKRP